MISLPTSQTPFPKVVLSPPCAWWGLGPDRPTNTPANTAADSDATSKPFCIILFIDTPRYLREVYACGRSDFKAYGRLGQGAIVTYQSCRIAGHMLRLVTAY